MVRDTDYIIYYECDLGKLFKLFVFVFLFVKEDLI